MRIGLAQMRVEPGRPDLNMRRIEGFAARARAEGVDILAFPEMCVGGYFLGDLWTHESFCRELESFNVEIVALSKGLVIVWGNILLDPARPNKDGRIRKYNAAFACQEGKPLKRMGGAYPLPDGAQAKTLLPNYRVFDDERWFYSGRDLALDAGLPLESLLRPFEAVIGGEAVAIGLEVCEDLWFADYRYCGEALNVSGMLAEAGARVIVNVSASPWTQGKGQARDRRIAEALKGRGVRAFAYVNCVGCQNNGKNFITFDGDSAVYSGDGRAVARAAEPWAEELVVWDEAGPHEESGRIVLPPMEYKRRAAVEGIRAMDSIVGSASWPWVIGLSGGVDSAVSACLLAQAAGPERVIALNMPTRFNSAATKRVAARVAEGLGIRYRELPVGSLAEANAELLKDFSLSPLNLENIQAKVRGTSVLSNVAAATGGLLVNNGNKLELAIGYATLYGDVDGALAPLGDLLKTEVFALARHMNEAVYGQSLVPEELLPDEDFNFTLPPTAELREAQIDPMKWGYHDALLEAMTDYRKASPVDVLSWYAEGSLCAKLGIPERLLARYGLDEPRAFVDDLEWFSRSMRVAVFKRIQAPPIIVMSRGSYGADIRESQLPRWDGPGYTKARAAVLR